MPDTFATDLLRRMAVPLLSLLLIACSTSDYYAHLSQGQWQLLHAREPVQRLLKTRQPTPIWPGAWR